MHTIRHSWNSENERLPIYFLQIYNVHLYHSTFLEFSKQERVNLPDLPDLQISSIGIQTKGRESTYQILSSILVCTPGAYCWLPNSQGHWLMGIQSPLSFRAWLWGQEQPSAQRVRSWVQTGLLEMMWQVRTHSLGQFWYTWPPLHGNSRGERLKFIKTMLGRWKVKVYSNYVLGIKGFS